MTSRKSMWATMDRLEGKKEGSSYKHLEKEMKRQGYSKSKALKKAKGDKLESRSKKAGFYVHGHKNFGDVYEA